MLADVRLMAKAHHNCKVPCMGLSIASSIEAARASGFVSVVCRPPLVIHGEGEPPVAWSSWVAV